MLVTLGADRAAIGPRFAPGRVPCLRSYVARRREIRGFEQYVEAHGRECTPARRDDTAGAIAAEANARLAAYLRAGGGRPDEVWTLDLGRGDWSAHRVLPHQGCPHCTPAMVTSAFPGFSCDAEVAAQAPEIHRDGYSGIVSRICDYDAETAPGAVCAFAEHLFPPDAGRTDAVWRGFRRRSSGKGRTRSEARQSALLEAIERYCGAASGGEPVVRASQAELGPEAVDAARCMGFSEQQYQQREQTNPGAPTQAWVPERSDRHRRMDWVAAWSLTAGKKRYVPARFCFYGYPEAGGGTGTFADSNGCAAGATVADAMVRGMLELVERDAVGLWWYNSALRPAPVREEETAREIAAMTVAYEPAGREVALLDLTTDFGIPAAAALSWQRGSGACITLGFGADFEAQQALRRAIAEMNQFLPEALEQGEGRVRGADPQRDRYLRACASAPRTPAAAWSGGPEALMARWVAEAGERGYEVVVVNQTRPGVGVPVVKVIMPGLCHFWPRFGAARLYQAPVAMGWIGKPKAEAELNPARLLL